MVLDVHILWNYCYLWIKVLFFNFFLEIDNLLQCLVFFLFWSLMNGFECARFMNFYFWQLNVCFLIFLFFFFERNFSVEIDNFAAMLCFFFLVQSFFLFWIWIVLNLCWIDCVSRIYLFPCLYPLTFMKIFPFWG